MADSPDRSLSSRLFGWARRAEGTGEPGRDAGPPVSTKVLAKFLAALAHRDAPVVLDLGPVVGKYTDWHPLVDRSRLFPEDVDASDPWQFKNVRVTG